MFKELAGRHLAFILTINAQTDLCIKLNQLQARTDFSINYLTNTDFFAILCLFANVLFSFSYKKTDQYGISLF